jgi:hypothetical protein
VEKSPSLGWQVIAALWVLGMGLITAALYFGFMFFINIVVGLSEPVHVTGPQWALIWSYVLAGALLFGTGIYCLMCLTRRQLRVLGGLIAATAAAVALSFYLFPKAV